MTTQNIIGYYKNWLLVELDETFAVVKRKTATEKAKILYSGSEDNATKMFTMLIAGFINESTLKETLSL